MDTKIILSELKKILPSKNHIYFGFISVVFCPLIGFIYSIFHKNDTGITLGMMFGVAALARLICVLDFKKKIDHILNLQK